MDCSPPGSSAHGIFQARVLERGAIAFSEGDPQRHANGLHTAYSESEVAQSCPTSSDPMDCSLAGSSVHEIFQARVPEWVAMS